VKESPRLRPHLSEGRGKLSEGVSARGHAEPRTCESEARHQRQLALGVPALARATAGSRRSSLLIERAEAEGPAANA
jgi:hypothetical protein